VNEILKKIPIDVLDEVLNKVPIETLNKDPKPNPK
jgi:hypothetical protein